MICGSDGLQVNTKGGTLCHTPAPNFSHSSRLVFGPQREREHGKDVPKHANGDDADKGHPHGGAREAEKSNDLFAAGDARRAGFGAGWVGHVVEF